MRNDIRLYTDFPTHYKTKLLIKLAGVDGVWALIKLWIFAASHCPEDGILRMNDEQIQAICDWNTDGIPLVEKLMECGFLEKTEGGYSLHDWTELQPFVVGFAERSRTNTENIKKRWAKEKGMDSTLDTDGIQPEYDSNTDGNTPTILPSFQPTIPKKDSDKPKPSVTKKSKKKQPKHQHGKKVLLTDSEYKKLCTDYTQKVVDNKIRDMNEWIIINGKKPFTDSNLAIRNWFRKDNIYPLSDMPKGYGWLCQHHMCGKYGEGYKPDKCSYCGSADFSTGKLPKDWKEQNETN